MKDGAKPKLNLDLLMEPRLELDHRGGSTGAHLPLYVPLLNRCDDITITVKRKDEVLSETTLEMVRAEQAAQRRWAGRGSDVMDSAGDGGFPQDAAWVTRNRHGPPMFAL